MHPPPQPHPDRLAATLLQVLQGEKRDAAATCSPAAGSADCRIDLKQLIHRAERAMARSEAARAHLADLDRERHPDLWAGTVQDGVARGFAARLEEACSLAPEPDEPPVVDDTAQTFEGRDLRRKKDLLVASGGARARFSRKGGVLLVDRASDFQSENCLWFEARRDHGTLDTFVASPDERPRLFSAQFLAPVRYVTGKLATELTLEGRLGRGPVGWPCRLVLRGEAHRDDLRLDVELPRVVVGWRLRSRFLAVPAALLQHACTPVREHVDGRRGGFVADTLVRSCARLAVGGEVVATPDAADPGPLRHRFSFGKRNS
jgi:hypothetical protein